MEIIIIILLSLFIILFLAIINIYFHIKSKLKSFSQEAFGTENIIEGIKKEELETQSTPKTITGMEKLDLPRLNNDFKNLNINELKRDSESKVINCLKQIEKKDSSNVKEEILKIWINNKLQELKDKNVTYDSIKIHKTILNRYEKKDAIATIKIHIALEYIYREDNKSPQKIQTRFELEYIYVIDEEKIGTLKGVGLNCPICGAPIKNLGDKMCDYCGSGVIDILKRTWVLNNIREF